LDKPAALNVSWREIDGLPRDVADHRFNYGGSPEQFGELRLPPTSGPHPVIVFIHGGCWLNKYSLDHVSAVSRALANEGYAVWTLEYRRIGDAGGGWPGTFEDVAVGVNRLRGLAPQYNLRLDRVTAMGHSAGGHLALWLATRGNLSGSGNSGIPAALPLFAVVALAGISDLLAYEALGNECAASLPELLGGTSQELPARWAEVDPMQLPAPNIPAHFIHGEIDSIVPLAQSETMALAIGGELHVIAGGGHFDMVSPHTEAWQTMCRVLKSISL
jgi:acetyl esterase/lipase